jgi:inositol transport system substrate-binding protein
MKKMKTLVSLALCALLLVIVAACGNKGTDNTASSSSNAPSASADNANSPAAAGGKKMKIGVTVYYMTEFITLAVEGVKKQAEAENAEAMILDANNDPAKQISQIENFISQKVDAIVVAAVDSDSLGPIVQKAKEAGIPLIGLNMLINSPDLIAYAGPNDVQAGELEMQYIADQIGGKGNIVVLDGPIGVSAQVQRSEGINNVLKKYPDIKVLSEKTANWSRSEALSLMENWLQSHGEKITAVVAQNDEMALGAFQALESKGLDAKIPVAGVDAIKDAVESINNGKLKATVFQDADKEGRLAIELAAKAVRKESIEKDNFIQMELVTKDNIDKYLALYK